jgi:hypothetical protein
MMIAAPLVLLIISINRRHFDKDKNITLSLAVLSVTFILFTYPFVVPFLLLYSLGIFLLNQIPRKLKIYVISATMFFIFSSLWIFFSDQRLKAGTSFRSWGSFMTPLAPSQYFGLVPGNVMDSTLMGNFQALSQRYSIDSARMIFLVSFIALFPILIILVVNFKSSTSIMRFTLIYSFALPLLIMFTSQDPYFFYKSSYIFQFLVIGFVIQGLTRINGFQLPLQKKLLKTYLILILVLNFSFNVNQTSRMIERNLEWNKLPSQIESIPEKTLAQTISLQSEGAVDNISSFYMSYRRSSTVDPNLAPDGLAARRVPS